MREDKFEEIIRFLKKFASQVDLIGLKVIYTEGGKVASFSGFLTFVEIKGEEIIMNFDEQGEKKFKKNSIRKIEIWQTKSGKFISFAGYAGVES
jgi:hypothetical protein